MTGAARTLARRAGRALLARRGAEALASAVAAGVAVDFAARLEGWAHPEWAAAAAALAALAAFAAHQGARRSAVAALDPAADADALLRAALEPAAGVEWRELLAGAAARRTPAFLPVGEWIPAAILATAAIFALAWQDSSPRYAPVPPRTAGGGIASAEDADSAAAAAALRQARGQVESPAGDGEAGGAQGEWRTLEPVAAAGSILLPPGSAARERGAIERYLRQRAQAAE